jgi:hypothetical protein
MMRLSGEPEPEFIQANSRANVSDPTYPLPISAHAHHVRIPDKVHHQRVCVRDFDGPMLGLLGDGLEAEQGDGLQGICMWFRWLLLWL